MTTYTFWGLGAGIYIYIYILYNKSPFAIVTGRHFRIPIYFKDELRSNNANNAGSSLGYVGHVQWPLSGKHEEELSSSFSSFSSSWMMMMMIIIIIIIFYNNDANADANGTARRGIMILISPSFQKKKTPSKSPQWQKGHRKPRQPSTMPEPEIPWVWQLVDI